MCVVIRFEAEKEGNKGNILLYDISICISIDFVVVSRMKHQQKKDTNIG